ncbi:aminoacetone oxidase family FAD-binding enzyme [Gordonibacter sp. An230]|uniref:aminoacetone oxidase family FAD-binding enzyme n=1 Tax=Gordonibacter sp. An230 TaxID=1965592 RepID=UPI001EF3F0B2|nr:aminoacetone oxidase family FAD-binding enzyme [Gordonibacter sp. An230]
METIAIIGGGASGLAAAVSAARTLASLGTAARTEVVVFEADERVGRSILATGNGRCNFSNACVSADAYRNASFVAGVLGALAPCGSADPVHAFFADLGLLWREEGDGRLYPLANKASSVLDVLRGALAREGVRAQLGHRATRIDRPGQPGGRYHVRFEDGSIAHARALVVATGGRTPRGLLPDALPFQPQHPVLGPLRTETAPVKPLNNIRVRCVATLAGPDGAPRASEAGEILFRDYGVSGIAVFNLSRIARPGDALLLDLVPQLDERACERELRARRVRLGAPTGEELLVGMLLPQVARAVLGQAGLRPDAPFADGDASVLAGALKGFALAVRGVGDARQCQVTRGGFDVSAFDARTMEARGLSGLFAAGEALDVDAPCGGYNLHWAWASGIVAGRAAANAVGRREGEGRRA